MISSTNLSKVDSPGRLKGCVDPEQLHVKQLLDRTLRSTRPEVIVDSSEPKLEHVDETLSAHRARRSGLRQSLGKHGGAFVASVTQLRVRQIPRAQRSF